MITHMIAWLRGVLQGPGAYRMEDLGVKELLVASDLEGVLQESNLHPVLIFKHSTTCPISASAQRRVAEYLAQAGDEAPVCFLVKVIESRPVSNEIAGRLQVTHQSPQIILVRNGAAVWSASHGAITGQAITAALQ